MDEEERVETFSEKKGGGEVVKKKGRMFSQS